MLVMPMVNDQFFNAESVWRLGVGIRSAHTASAAQIGDAVDRLLRGPYRRAVAALRAEIARSDDREDAFAVLRDPTT